MIFKEQKMAGIKSFSEERTFKFPSKPGLYFMFGRNESEPRMGSNAAGKSSLWDTVTWTLYGKTLRGMKAGNIKSWKAKKPFYGSLTFLDEEGKERNIYRSMEPNKILLDDKMVTQEEILEAIRIPFDSFVYSIIFGQKNQKFFDLLPAAKLKLFTDILNLDDWLLRSKKASSSHAEARETKRDLTEDLSYIKGKQEELKKSLGKTQKFHADWGKSKESRVRVLKDELSATEKEIKKNKKDLTHLQNHLESLDDVGRELLGIRGEEYRTLGKKTNRLDILNKKIGQALGEKDAAKEDYSEFRRFESSGKKSRCGSCMQIIDKDHYNSRLRKLKDKWKKASKAVPALLVEREELEEKIQKIKNKLSILDRKTNNHLREVDGIKSDYHSANRRLRDLEKKKKETLNDLQEVQEQKNPFKEEIKTTLKEMNILKKSSAVMDRAISHLERDLEYSKYWEKGFREVRLFLVSEFLTQFEIEANNYLSKLGMEKWGLSFDVETETKSKTVSKGFSVMVQSPYNKKPVPWESWSGGEMQRLLLSSSIGLSNLIFDRYGVSSNLEVWDEPSSWLSEEGILDLLETLSMHSIQENKQIWVADQRFLEYGNFDDMVTVVKDKYGSHFEWGQHG